MVDDYYSEQEQWERAKAWLRENGLWLLAGVALGVLGLVGWQWWQQRVETQAQLASGKYQRVLEALERGDRTRAFTLLGELREDHARSPYADQGELLAARVHVEANELQQAAERLTRVMTDSRDEQLRLIARARLARVQLAQGNHDLALGTLSAGEAGAFAARFEEIRGDALLAKGDRSAALRAYRKARELDTERALDAEALELKLADLVADGVSDGSVAQPRAGAPQAPVAASPAKVQAPTQAKAQARAQAQGQAQAQSTPAQAGGSP